MTPTIPSSTSNISFIPGAFFTRRPNKCLTRCSNFGRSTKQTLFSQTYILPLSASARLFPQLRNGCNLLSKSRIFIASATGTDEAVEEQDSLVTDGGTLGMLSNAADPTEDSSFKSDATPAPVRSKRSRPARKSEMPPVNNEELVPGATFTGKVRSIQPFGAFVDFGAFTDGLVHVSRLSDSFVKDVGSVVSVGQEVKVRLVEANTETGRISLTMRESDDIGKLQQQRDSPANSDRSRPPRRKSSQKKEEVKKSSKFVKGQDLEGTVKNITRAGAFISLPEGEEGFLPISEESDDPFANIMGNSSLQVGQKVNVRVLRIARAQVTLTMKKEEDAGELDSKLSQGVVHTATNPFVLAFRQNKDIAAFLDEREKEEVLAENSGIQETSKEVVGKLSQMADGHDTPSVEHKSMSSCKELVSEPSAFDETVGDDENSTEEVDVEVSVVDDTLTETTSKEDGSESIVAGQQADVVDVLDTQETQDTSTSSSKELFSDPSASDETVDHAGNPSEEVDAVVSPIDDALTGTTEESPESIVSGQSQTVETSSESLPPEDGKYTAKETIKASPAKHEVENDGESELFRQIDGQTSASESVIVKDVTGSQADNVIPKNEVQVEISSVEDKAPSHSSIEEENVSPDPEKNGSITSSNGQINDPPPPESTTEEKQIGEEALKNQIDSTMANDQEVIKTHAADSKNPSATAAELKEKGHIPDKNGSATKSNGQSDASLQKEASTKAAISPALVKQLREETGAGMMDCKKALSETGGDIVKAQEYLRKKGLASAEKKASRATAEGRIGSYIHDSRIGVLIEVNCETDFVSRGEIFKELVDDLAMQVAACPQVQYLVTEDVPQEFVDKEREIEIQKEDLSSKPEQIKSKIVEGRIRKRLEELALLEQPYIKNDKVVVKDWVKQTIATIGENIKVKRFVRYNLGEGLEKRSQDFAAEVAAQTAAKPVPAPEKEQPAIAETKEIVEAPSKAMVSAALVKQLREETGAGMMDCKRALSETGGDLEKAQEYLRKKGLSTADKKSSRLAAEGRIGSYIHDSRIGVLIEVNCETDFVGRSEKFKELVDDLAMQVVACPQVQYVSIEDIPESIVKKEKELEMQREDLLSKPENIREKIVDGRVSKRLGELALLEQPFIKNDSVFVKELVKQTVAALGENIRVRRFVRFTL